jgi:hypothetical protein
MKANEAPEKIWIDTATDLPKLSGHIDKDSVEYIRKDAFIEKAYSWLENNLQGIVGGGIYMEDFRNYMEGE